MITFYIIAAVLLANMILLLYLALTSPVGRETPNGYQHEIQSRTNRNRTQSTGGADANKPNQAQIQKTRRNGGELYSK